MLLRDILTESQIDLQNKKAIDRLAHDLSEQSFPKSFTVTVESAGTKFPLTFELSEKKINDHKGYHVLTFVYELDSKSSKRVDDAIRKAEVDDDFYDTLSQDLKVRTIEVHAEIGKGIEKVFGHAS